MNELLLLTVNQAQGAPAGGGGGGMMGLMPLILMFAIFYFLLIRPQQKRQKAHQAMLSRLKKGDHVVTAGGIGGNSFALTDTELVLEIADKVKVRVLRSQVNAYTVASSDTGKDE